MNCFLSIAEEAKNWKLDEALFSWKVEEQKFWLNKCDQIVDKRVAFFFFVKIRIGGAIFTRLESKRVKDMRLHKNSNT